ncbi:TPA: hypothetical protein ACN6Y1_004736, partial [Escherichia albertii]
KRNAETVGLIRRASVASGIVLRLSDAAYTSYPAYKQHRLWAVLSFLRQALFRQTGNTISAHFSIY